jgi:adenine phosphoribosyltransferase
MTLRELKKTLRKATLMNRNGHKYFIHPIADGIPCINPSMLNEITDVITSFGNTMRCYDRSPPDVQFYWENVDYLVTVEALGIPITTAVSLSLNIPMNIIRKREYNLPGEIKISQKTAYSKNDLYINGLEKGDHIVIIDDVISTGGTLTPIILELQRIGVIIDAVIVVIGRDDGFDDIFATPAMPPLFVLVEIKVDEENDSIEIIECY